MKTRRLERNIFYRYSFFYALTINKQKKDFILNRGLVNNTNTKTKT